MHSEILTYEMNIWKLQNCPIRSIPAMKNLMAQLFLTCILGTDIYCQEEPTGVIVNSLETGLMCEVQISEEMTGEKGKFATFRIANEGSGKYFYTLLKGMPDCEVRVVNQDGVEVSPSGDFIGKYRSILPRSTLPETIRDEISVGKAEFLKPGEDFATTVRLDECFILPDEECWLSFHLVLVDISTEERAIVAVGGVRVGKP